MTDRWFRTGETALLAVVPEAEPAVGGWRERFDPAAAAMIPAHVTVLYPFLDIGEIDDSVTAELATVFAGLPPFTVTFATCRRFPGVLYLAPEPGEPFRALTSLVTRRWPDHQPYRGQFAEVVPHLTIADGCQASVLNDIEREVGPYLPVVAPIRSIALYVVDGRKWIPHADFPLAAS